MGCLCRPFQRIGNDCREIHLFLSTAWYGERITLLHADGLSCGIFQCGTEGKAFSGSPVQVLNGHLHAQFGIAVRLIQHGPDNEITHPHPGCGKEIYIAIDAAEPPEVLVFDITAVGQVEHLHGHLIAALFHIFSDVELGRKHPVLVIPHLLSVDPEIHGRLYTGKVNEYLCTVPCRRELEILFVDGGGVIILWHERGIGFEGIFDIGEDRRIVPAIVLQLPVGGYLDIVPAGRITFPMYIGRDQPRVPEIAELPGAVEQLHLRRLRQCVVVPL